LGEAQIALLIDFENVGLDFIRPLLDQLSDLGRIIIRRAYADWSKAANQRDQLLQLGLDPIHVFRSSASGKNSCDIRLVIDAVDLLYRSPVDTFVIVSSDSDFVPLVTVLRSAGKTVIGAGRRAIVSSTLVTSCDRYFFLDEVEGEKQPVPARRRGAAKPQAEPSDGRSDAQEEAVSLLLRALRAAMDRDYEGKVYGSRLHETMTRIDPSFNFRALGFRTFTQFLDGTGEVIVKHPPGQGDTEIELKAASSSEPESRQSRDASPNGDWEAALDAALEARARETGREQVPGTWAAERAAKLLGAASLRASRYKTLRKLLEASPLLRDRWVQVGSHLVRKQNGAMAPSVDGGQRDEAPQPAGDLATSSGDDSLALGGRPVG
jgi:uncharacterized protein (TIGR00288 family)